MAQGRVLSPLLFNLLVNGLAASVRQAAPGVQFGVSHRFTNQLYADDLVVTAECQHDLQVALDAVSAWGHRWRFSFGIGPTKSAVMVFGPRRGVLPCSVFLSGHELPLVSEYPYLGVILTPSLSWTAHARHLVSRGNRLFAQCVAWCRSERLPLWFASTLFTSYVLPSISWSMEFFVSSPPALQVIDTALRRWGRFLLGWPAYSPIASVFLELGWPDASHISTSRLLSLFGRMHAMPAGDRCPLPALVFHTMFSVPESWVARCVSICDSLRIPLPSHCGVGVGSSAHSVRLWSRSCVRTLDQCLHGRLFQAASTLSVSHVDPSSSTVNCGPDEVVYRFPRPSHSRFLGLARLGHDPLPGGRAARHLALPSSCSFCDATQGDLFHCLSECAAFSDLCEQWCRRVSVHPNSIPFWVRHPWLFNPTSSFNTFRTVLAHVSFVGQACERFVSL